ncbi:MAG TPA: monovalent cation/H+ antiporter complex subunit F [Syntrophales bacterium]|nr:monovalent cation/H+ antiporter complex subunit F [Syntrophales bacterium]
MMTDFMLYGGVAILLLMLAALYRLVWGPTVFDRLVSANMIGTKTTVLLLFIGVLYDHLDMFVDIAIAYTLLNFITTLAAAKYFQRRPPAASRTAGAGGEVGP